MSTEIGGVHIDVGAVKTSLDKTLAQARTESEKLDKHFKATAVNIAASMQKIDTRAKVWGTQTSSVAEKQDLLKKKMNELIDEGIEPTNKKFQKLSKQYKALERQSKRSAGNMAASMKKVDARAQVWGRHTNSVAEKQGILKKKMDELIEGGIKPTNKGFQKLIKQYQTLERQSGQSLKKISSDFVSAGKSASLYLTAPLIGAAVVATKAAFDINKGMGAVATLIPNSLERVKELKGDVQATAIAVGKSTDDISNGLYQVVSAFGHSAESADQLKISAKAATAGGAETVDALNLISAVTKAYGDTSAKAQQEVSDFAFTTVKLGQTTFPELAASIQGVTSDSQSMGVSQQELFTVMSTLTGVTGNASMVSTQLRSALVSMAAPTESMTALYHSMGVESGAGLIKKMGGLQGAMIAITTAAKKSKTPLKDYIGRVEGQKVAMQLSGTMAKVYAKKFEQMGDAVGATDEAFKEVTSGINATGFSFEQTKVKAAVLAQNMGELLLPAVDSVISVVGGAIEGFTGLSGWQQKTILTVAGLAAAIGPATLLMGKMIAVYQTALKITALFKVAKTGEAAALGMSTAQLMIHKGTQMASALATKAVTVATYLFNTALKANPIGAVIGVVAALTAGIWALVNAKGASIKKAREEAALNEKKLNSIKKLYNEYKELSAQEDKSAATKKRLKELSVALYKEIPEANAKWDEQTGKIKINTKAIEEQIKVRKERDTEAKKAEIQIAEDEVKSAQVAMIMGQKETDFFTSMAKKRAQIISSIKGENEEQRKISVANAVKIAKGVHIQGNSYKNLNKKIRQSVEELNKKKAALRVVVEEERRAAFSAEELASKVKIKKELTDAQKEWLSNRKSLIKKWADYRKKRGKSEIQLIQMERDGDIKSLKRYATKRENITGVTANRIRLVEQKAADKISEIKKKAAEKDRQIMINSFKQIAGTIKGFVSELGSLLDTQSQNRERSAHGDCNKLISPGSLVI